MLVLSRKIGQKIVIETKEGNIVMEFVRISKGSIRLGFEAPKTIKIRREEIGPLRKEIK